MFHKKNKGHPRSCTKGILVFTFTSGKSVADLFVLVKGIPHQDGPNLSQASLNMYLTCILIVNYMSF